MATEAKEPWSALDALREAEVGTWAEEPEPRRQERRRQRVERTVCYERWNEYLERKELRCETKRESRRD